MAGSSCCARAVLAMFRCGGARRLCHATRFPVLFSLEGHEGHEVIRGSLKRLMMLLYGPALSPTSLDEISRS